MIDYLDLLVQKQRIDIAFSVFKSALKIKPDFWQLIVRKAFPSQTLNWTVESKMIRHFDDALPPERLDEKSFTRIPLVLISALREYAVVVEIKAARYESFRLHALENATGLSCFCVDYDLAPNAQVKLVSISVDGDKLIDVKNYLSMSIREEILPDIGLWDLSDDILDILLLQLSDIMDQFPEYPLPLIDQKTDVLEFINDNHHWLDLERRLNHLGRSLCMDLPDNIYWSIEEIQVDQQDSINLVPLYVIIFRYHNQEAFRYCPLRHLIVANAETFTMCDEVEYMLLLDSIRHFVDGSLDKNK